MPLRIKNIQILRSSAIESFPPANSSIMMREFKKRHWQVVQRVFHSSHRASKTALPNGAISFISCMPTEILAMIIAEAWSLSLSTFDRIHLMISLPRVCRRWFLVFHYVASMAIHIPSGLYYRHLFSLLTSKKSFTHHPKYIKALSHPCRSVNLLVDEEYTFTGRSEPGMTSFLLGGMGNLLPNLRTINIIIRHPVFTRKPALPAGLIWGKIPPQVTDLNLCWEDEKSRGEQRGWLKLPYHTFMLYIPNGSNFRRVRRLSISGPPDQQVIAEFVARCPRLETLQIEAQLEPCCDHHCAAAQRGFACTPLLVVHTELLNGTLLCEWEAYLVSNKDGILTFRHVESLYDDEDDDEFSRSVGLCSPSRNTSLFTRILHPLWVRA